MNKIKVKVCHKIETYKQESDDRQVYQLKLQTQLTTDDLGETNGKYYYINVLEPKIDVDDVIEIDLDNYETYTKEFTPKGEEKIILLTYLKRVK